MTLMQPLLPVPPSVLDGAEARAVEARLPERSAVLPATRLTASGQGDVLRRHLMVGLALSLVALGMLLHRAGLRIDPWRAGNLPFYLAGALALACRHFLPRMRWRHAPAGAAFSEYAALFAVISLMGAAASYPVAALTHGYADDALQRIDEALGFDWLALYRQVVAHPWLQVLGTTAYRSIYITPALLLWSAAKSGQREAAYRFLAGFWLAAVITLAVFSLMPALGPFSHLWHQPIVYMPESELWQPGLIPALRAHGVHVVDLAHLRGIVSAPSFHTAAAVLYIVAAWRIRGLRWPVIALNAAMLLSTPVEGTHYLIDMILGAAVAVTALLLLEWHVRRLKAGAFRGSRWTAARQYGSERAASTSEDRREFHIGPPSRQAEGGWAP